MLWGGKQHELYRGNETNQAQVESVFRIGNKQTERNTEGTNSTTKWKCLLQAKEKGLEPSYYLKNYYNCLTLHFSLQNLPQIK